MEVYRIAETMARTPRFAERVFTPAEREYCDAKGAAAAESYAGRFAAKEAFLKALKTGWRGKITWQDIEVVNNAAGVPSLQLSGSAAELFEKSGATQIHVSISHTSEHAVAMVVTERLETPKKRGEPT